MTRLAELKDPKKGTPRLLVNPELKKISPKLKELLEEVKMLKHETDILKKVDKMCKAQGEGQFMFRVKITKQIAGELFSRNIANNRDIKFWKVEEYATQMKKGEWDYNGPVIRFSVDGKLMDCQHQLLSIYLSNTVQSMHIECGFPLKNLRTIDTGAARTAADLLKMKGISVAPNTMAAAIKKVILFNNDGRIHVKTHGAKVTNIMVNDFIESKQENIQQLASYVQLGLKKFHHENPYFTGAEWGFIYYILARTKNRRDQANDFIESLTTGKSITNRGQTSPIWHCRRLLLGWKATKKNHAWELTLKLKYLIAYWNNYVGAEKSVIDPERGIILNKTEQNNPFILRPL